MQTIEQTVQVYKQVIDDVLNNRNLGVHLLDVNNAIEETEKLIHEAVSKGAKTDGYENLKNELYFLKWQIKERM